MRLAETTVQPPALSAWSTAGTEPVTHTCSRASWPTQMKISVKLTNHQPSSSPRGASCELCADPAGVVVGRRSAPSRGRHRAPPPSSRPTCRHAPRPVRRAHGRPTRTGSERVQAERCDGDEQHTPRDGAWRTHCDETTPPYGHHGPGRGGPRPVPRRYAPPSLVRRALVTYALGRAAPGRCASPRGAVRARCGGAALRSDLEEPGFPGRPRADRLAGGRAWAWCSCWRRLCSPSGSRRWSGW